MRSIYGLLLFPLLLTRSHLLVAQELECRLCSAATPSAQKEGVPRQPIHIEIETALDFSRATQSASGDGEIGLDPQSGARRVSGSLSDLGGMALRGSARISGQPMQPLRITLPNSVELRSSTGGVAEVVDIQSDLGPAPMLGPDGVLRFSFGGRLRVKGRVSGNFRGSIPITADYQ
jgi:Domain of unknown function (DUF4402)